jgi:hypothetical protein
MSDRKDAPGSVRIVPAKATPSPDYHYQKYGGKSGSISASPSSAPDKKFAALQHFVLNAD